MTRLTKKDIDHLAQVAAEIIGFKSGAVVAYDVAGYQRCPGSLSMLLPSFIGSFETRFSHKPTPPAPPEARPTSLIRPGWPFRRRDMFGPDESAHACEPCGLLSTTAWETAYESIDHEVRIEPWRSPDPGVRALPYVADWPPFGAHSLA
jgi:hypothetical protein